MGEKLLQQYNTGDSVVIEGVFLVAPRSSAKSQTEIEVA
jgi:hypothetical protein